MIRPLLLTTALLGAIATPAQAYSDLTSQKVLEGTGTACLTGGAVVGLTMLMAGPTVMVVSATTSTVVPATTTATISALFTCGISAAAAVSYYGGRWLFDTLFTPPPYPLLYPAREELAPAPPSK